MKAEAIAIAGATVGLLATTGCQTRYSQQQDLSLTRPMPQSMQSEPLEGIVYKAPETPREKPYWQTHPQTVTSAVSVTPTPAATTYTTYVVKKGDMLSKIAAEHNIRTADLAAANPGINVNRIRVGQKISIPSSGTPGYTASKAHATAAQGGTYVVKKGDILGRIANAHGVKLADLRKANNLSGDKIFVGQKLVIPGAATTTATAKTASVKKDDKPATTTAEVKPVKPQTVQPKPPVIDPAPVAPVEIPTPELAPVAPPMPPVIDKSAKPKQTSTGTPYIVQEGEDLYDVAVRWGVSTADLKKLNNLESDKLSPGQSLTIPAAR
jgi:LysM repeat protein